MSLSSKQRKNIVHWYSNRRMTVEEIAKYASMDVKRVQETIDEYYYEAPEPEREPNTWQEEELCVAMIACPDCKAPPGNQCSCDQRVDLLRELRSYLRGES